MLLKYQVYIIAEGISSNLFKKMHKLNRKNVNVNRLVEILEKLKVSSLKSPEKVSFLYMDVKYI